MSQRDITPEGRYPAVAIPVADPDDGNKLKVFRFGKAGTGTVQIVVALRIVRGERAGDVLTWFGSYTKDSWERTTQSMRYLGWKGSDISIPGPCDQEVEIEVENEVYNGDLQAKIKWINPAGGGGGFKLKSPIIGQELAALVAKMRAQAKNFPEVEGPRVDRSVPVVRAAGEQREPGVDEPSPRGASDWERGDTRTSSYAAAPGSAGGGGGGWTTAPAGPPAANTDDDIPFSTCDLGAEPDPRAKWSRWP